MRYRAESEGSNRGREKKMGRKRKKKMSENEKKGETVSFSCKPNLSGVFLRQQTALTGCQELSSMGIQSGYLGTLCYSTD